MMCNSNINTHGTCQNTPNNTTNLQTLYNLLPEARQKLCGEIKLLEEGGKELITHLKSLFRLSHRVHAKPV